MPQTVWGILLIHCPRLLRVELPVVQSGSWDGAILAQTKIYTSINLSLFVLSFSSFSQHFFFSCTNPSRNTDFLFCRTSFDFYLSISPRMAGSKFDIHLLLNWQAVEKKRNKLIHNFNGAKVAVCKKN